MGVHKSTPIPAMMGDMGWVDIHIKQILCMARYWNRILNLDHSRLPKRLFLWDYYLLGNTWSKEILNIYKMSTTFSTHFSWYILWLALANSI